MLIFKEGMRLAPSSIATGPHFSYGLIPSGRLLPKIVSLFAAMTYLSEALQQRSNILAGISAELRQTAKYGDFVVTKREVEGQYWKLNVEVTRTNKLSLDESLEGASMWWAGPPTGAADVLSVLPEQQQINIRYATNPPPDTGKLVRIYPAQYLEALYACWQDSQLAQIALSWPAAIEAQNKEVGNVLAVPPEFHWLRVAQRKAFDLPKWSASFLWGPPGTGKTTTLGAMLATHLSVNSSDKVLLMSRTHFKTGVGL